ncbi:MAG: glycosyltransferase family 2 protein [Pseudanabaenaceae cyanobacterium]
MLYFLTVNYYAAPLISKLLQSLANLTLKHQVIVVNNSPWDEGIKQLQYPCLEVIETGANLGFGGACNVGLELIYARSPQATVWLINPDAYFDDVAALGEILPNLQAYPIVGTYIYDPQGKLIFSGGKFRRWWGVIVEETEAKSELIRATDWVSGGSMIINLAHFPICPLFDRSYFLYYEDFDFCRRYAPCYICRALQVIHAKSSLTSQLNQAKVSQEIYSYLLTLARHTPPPVLWYRLCRIILVSLWQILRNFPQGHGKLKGVIAFLTHTPLHIV